MNIEALPLEILILDKNGPVPGNDGIITNSLVTGTSIQVLWSAASDVETAPEDLEYRLYMSSSNNIPTPADAINNGEIVYNWEAGITTGVATGLSPGTTYFFNVVVRDGDGLMAAYRTISITTYNGPIPGNDGIITNNLVTGTSIQVLWSAASDVETAPEDLEYCLYMSSSNNISTPEDAENNGAVVLEWIAGQTTDIVTGLTPGTTYFFNVVVRDGDGLMAAYRTVSITTQTDSVFLFPAGSFPGNLALPTTASVRADIDGLCMEARLDDYPSLPCLNVRAFISITASDDIAGMPGHFGVPTGRKIVGPTGMTVAVSWADLLDGTINGTLSGAGIAPDDWWSGSAADGTFNAEDNCGTWMSSGLKGIAGKNNKSDDTWINGNSIDCSATRSVLCACW